MSDLEKERGLAPAVLNRLRKRAAEFGNYEAVARASGVPIGTLQKMMRGATEPKFSMIIDIASAIGVSVDYLITGIGEESGDWETNMPQIPRGHLRVPIFDGKISAGSGQSVFDGEPIDYMDFPTEYLKRLGNPTEMHAVAVGGDSMEPELRNGDIIVVDYSQRTPREAIFAFNVEQLALVKRLRFKADGVAELVSSNPRYPPFDVSLSDENLIVGKVVWAGKAL